MANTSVCMAGDCFFDGITRMDCIRKYTTISVKCPRGPDLRCWLLLLYIFLLAGLGSFFFVFFFVLYFPYMQRRDGFDRTVWRLECNYIDDSFV